MIRMDGYLGYWLRIIGALIVFAAVLIVSDAFSADQAPYSEVRPGGAYTKKYVNYRGKRVAIDNYGCGYVGPAQYLCFKGPFAGTLWTTREEMLFVGPFAFRPDYADKINEAAKPKQPVK